ncbi:hypothetical protein GYMLUDRAFT_247778 [Collybiopsis luxurians FD-317 M1]|uniref:Uncharacterized protein n=1 Tax=Collybiopsis luxurians FD-317 M1 TaxID=944289 RepID=A0A0D0CET4_9AGAR|nr:hypothetical protein GYMLUDRAFT_247778 [Collybiopsis luxurians FD-317 M1]
MMWAAVAMEDIDVALEILKSVADSKFGSAIGATFIINSKDSIQIIEALKHRAEIGSAPHNSPFSWFTRFCISSSVGAASSQPPLPSKWLPPCPAVNGAADKPKYEPLSVNMLPKGNDKEKKQKKPYPAVGMRKHPAKDGSPLTLNFVIT